MTDSEACNSEMGSSPLVAQKMAQDMLIGAFFSTRGLKDVTLGGLSSP